MGRWVRFLSIRIGFVVNLFTLRNFSLLIHLLEKFITVHFFKLLEGSFILVHILERYVFDRLLERHENNGAQMSVLLIWHQKRRPGFRIFGSVIVPNPKEIPGREQYCPPYSLQLSDTAVSLLLPPPLPHHYNPNLKLITKWVYNRLEAAHEAAPILAEIENTAKIKYKKPRDTYKEREYTQSIKREMKKYSTAQKHGKEVTKTKDKKNSLLTII